MGGKPRLAALVTVLLCRVWVWLTQPRVTHAIEATTGTILIAFGLRLALERAR